jgi:hypothetical protein
MEINVNKSRDLWQKGRTEILKFCGITYNPVSDEIHLKTRSGGIGFICMLKDLTSKLIHHAFLRNCIYKPVNSNRDAIHKSSIFRKNIKLMKSFH